MTVASIDIGTNTILLLIAEVNTENKKIQTIKNLHSIPRIGKGLQKGNPFPGENIKRLIDTLTQYYKEIKKYNCGKILLTGTNAFRIASDSDKIIKEIKNRFDFELKTISGEEEARYSYLGAVNEYLNNQDLVVIDIGGGSTEIIHGTGSTIKYSKSFSIGVVTGTENFLKSDPPSKKQIKKFSQHIYEIFKEITEKVKKIDIAFAIAGTPTTLACIKHKLKNYDEEIIEDSFLTAAELNLFIDELSQLGSAEIFDKYGTVVRGREDILLAGTIILSQIVNLLELNEVRVSTKGIRYGAIINWLNTYDS